MSTIWKFEVTGAFIYDPILGGKAQVNDIFEIEMPAGTKLLNCGEQNKTLVLWGFVPDVNANKYPMRIQVVGTGWDMKETTAEWRYLGTVQREDSSLVAHVFYEQFIRIRKEDQ